MLFRPSSGQVVEGIVLDVGWYRTTIRSFEREHFLIPNSGEMMGMSHEHLHALCSPCCQ